MGAVELCAKTHFSFHRGASSPRAMFERAKVLGYRALGIVDTNGLYGIVRAYEAARETGVSLVVGAEVTLVHEDASHALALHVEHHAGYRALCQILTTLHANRSEVPVLAIETLEAHHEGLFALVFPPFQSNTLEALRSIFQERLSLGMYFRLDGEDAGRYAAVKSNARHFQVPVCATSKPLYAQQEDKPLLDILTAILHKCPLDELGRVLSPNCEASLKPPEELNTLFRENPEWLVRAEEIADRCTFRLSELSYAFPFEVENPLHPGETPQSCLERLVWKGAGERYPSGIPASVDEALKSELRIIDQLKVAPYFLSVHSIVCIAKERDILCQGRGSAANSAVCFVLGITAVDPARASLLFERFLSPERHEPPDIDVDFEHERREEVIQEIYRRYGRDRAAMVSEIITYRAKSAIRDVGKAFGLSLDQVERVSSLLSYWHSVRGIAPALLREVGLDPSDPRFRQVLHFAEKLQGYPRHLSIHVGGFVLSASPLSNVAPVEPAAMPNRTIIPWDKDDLDTLGFFKIDVLSLGMLTAIRKALCLAEGDPRVGPGSVNHKLANIPSEDPKVYEALSRADTVGVFQIESRAQMSMLPRLRPTCFYDLVIEVAIVRPGPIQGGMVHPYLRRRNGEEAPEAPHPVLHAILERTLGVPLFQEQVMQIAMTGAGYTGGEADQLRRDMAAWRRTGKLERHRERLLSGFRARGIEEAFAERLFSQIQGFGEYGFPESHAASFALLVYASAWLKVHHPAAFAVGLLNSQPMGFYSPNTILEDAKRHGIRVLPIAIERSDWDYSLEGGAIRVGLRAIKGLGESSANRLVSARRERPFQSLEEMAVRASLHEKEVEAIALSGAWDHVLGGRRGALWQAMRERAGPLFSKVRGAKSPSFSPLTEPEQLALDFERTGISVGHHPVALLRNVLPRGVLGSWELAERRQGEPVSVAGLVICRQRPATASGVVFITLEDERGFLNLILYAHVFEKFRRIATRSTFLCATGSIERDGPNGSVIYVVVKKLVPLRKSPLQDLRSASRDFH